MGEVLELISSDGFTKLLNVAFSIHDHLSRLLDCNLSTIAASHGDAHPFTYLTEILRSWHL